MLSVVSLDCYFTFSLDFGPVLEGAPFFIAFYMLD